MRNTYAPSSTHERKSKSYVIMKNERIWLRHNVLTEDVPIVLMFKALGIQNDGEVMILTSGSDALYQDMFAVNYEECAKLNVTTQQEALEWLGSRLKIKRVYDKSGTRSAQEALQALREVIICHVPVVGMDFRPKALYVAFMARRVMMAYVDGRLVDDRDYVGNKRLELAGQLLSLLFEDLFKKFNQDLKMSLDKVFRKQNRTEHDPILVVQAHVNHITQGLNRALSSGNWIIKRFKMNRAGITHVLSRLSYISALGMMTPILPRGKHVVWSRTSH